MWGGTNDVRRDLVTLACRTVLILSVVGLMMLPAGEEVYASSLASHLRQVAPMHQDSLKVPSPNDPSKPATLVASSPVDANSAMMDAVPPSFVSSVNGYDPSGRRDPFAPILQQLSPGQVDLTLPPLQRVGLTDMNLIAVVWGAYGYTAMVQTPDGNGYSVRKGTRMGPNNGVVSAITEKGIIVQERFTDVYGRKQEREYVKLLHPKEGSE
ncbi:putative Type IV pilus assembly protein PilP [Nitrospira sp. KM1]|uniref:pilus assembly protein PilP n=1 Tax=Nitrospira sp. KM1 TaxID=1936990 RepID=UPI0013A79A1B|nr:pilus assembly protein PilP [Nitrospira sp. KM1]BCA56764.1 putative Type IV pilus assembly protein PilP [Nitrospira sp. KM1]